MAHKKKKPSLVLENLLVVDIAAEGKAIAKYNDMVVFIPFAIPGDVVDAQVTGRRKSYMEARVVNFHRHSPERVDPFCRHFGVCGGCKWQMLPYELQLRYKQNQVTDQLSRIGKVELPEIKPILGSEKTKYYRNKLEFTFSNKRWRTFDEINSGQNGEGNYNAVGFHIPKMFDKVLDIDECLLQDDVSNQIRNEIRAYALQHNLPFFDLKQQEGWLRTMIVRTASTGELMVIVVFFYDDTAKRQALLEQLSDKFPQIDSLLYVINPKANDTITDREVFTFKGKPHIFETMEGLRFKIGPKSFYQTNSEQAYTLYKTVRKFARLTGNESVYDLYTGTGTIANFIAKDAGKVVGIEYVPEAIEDAKENASINGIENVLFFAGDMKDVLNGSFIETHGKPDVIITDPPRAGMHNDVIDAMLVASPERIVYVSCNPATQARDVNMLHTAYKVTAVQPVDMFPHTHHVENVVLLEKK
ncbi:MAG: 23S rRNA (uracil(1939)-C(5))-methyltransferase RlmD [Prevotellaceae bacterium]|jgi:23S rRNA (uracil1939-C5)-methyltransferase|nr:23S rRNA (uracil(1939)-C(5))-methyltransferase RlmD [Prevotellaceae bacterium]